MAVRWGYIEKNVVRNVDKMKFPEKERRFLRQEEISALLKAAEGSHVYPVLVMAVHTGLRKSELLNLKWSDIDFERQTVTVQAKDDWHTKNYKSRTIHVNSGLKVPRIPV